MAAVLAVAGAAWFFAGRDDGGDEGGALPPVDIAEGERSARTACRHLATFEQLVVDNARSDRVKDELRLADEAATAAVEADPRWRSLASGTDALEVAIDDDDAAAARVGIDVVRAQCQTLE